MNKGILIHAIKGKPGKFIKLLKKAFIVDEYVSF